MNDSTTSTTPKTQAEQDYDAGWYAFPLTQWMDAERGLRSYPSLQIRCPFKKPERVAAWNKGFDEAHEAAMQED